MQQQTVTNCPLTRVRRGPGLLRRPLDEFQLVFRRKGYSEVQKMLVHVMSFSCNVRLDVNFDSRSTQIWNINECLFFRSWLTWLWRRSTRSSDTWSALVWRERCSRGRGTGCWWVQLVVPSLQKQTLVLTRLPFPDLCCGVQAGAGSDQQPVRGSDRGLRGTQGPAGCQTEDGHGPDHHVQGARHLQDQRWDLCCAQSFCHQGGIGRWHETNKQTNNEYRGKNSFEKQRFFYKRMSTRNKQINKKIKSQYYNNQNPYLEFQYGFIQKTLSNGRLYFNTLVCNCMSIKCFCLIFCYFIYQWSPAAHTTPLADLI